MGRDNWKINVQSLFDLFRRILDCKEEVRLKEGEEDSLAPSRKVDLSKEAKNSREKQEEVHFFGNRLEEIVCLDHREEVVVRIVDHCLS